MLRTTTTAAPAAGDSMFVLGEWTAAATKTNRAVTMDETASTDYGGTSTTLSSLGISVGGTLAYGTAAATNYVLRLSGVLDVWAGGTLTIGTNPATGGTSMPRDSTAVLEFDCAADGDFGFRLWGTAVFRAYGLSRTLGKDVVQCLLNTDEAAAQTVLGVDTDTGWLNGDTIAIASTSQTATDAETATLNGAAGATSITVSAGIAASHLGTAANLTQAEVILLTRNVMVRSVSSTFMSYGKFDGSTANATGATIEWAWVDFRYLGSSASTKNGALHALSTPASVSASFCNFRDGESNGLIFAAHANVVTGTLTVTDCTFYNIGVGSSSIHAINISSCASASVTCTITRCTWIGDNNASSTWSFFNMEDATSPFLVDSCRMSSGSGTGITISGSSDYSISKRITGCNIHCLGRGITLSASSGLQGVVIEDCTLWRNPTAGTGVGAISCSSPVFDLLVEDCVFFGNGALGASFAASSPVVGAVFRNCSFSGDTTFGCARGMSFTQSQCLYRARFENCTFGVVTGIRVAHTTASIGSSGALTNCTIELTLVNTNLADATEFETNMTVGALGRSFAVRQRKDQTTNTHEKLYWRLGTVAYDTVTFRTASPSEKMTPTFGTSTLFKLRGSPKRVPVISGRAVTVSCYVRKDGSYNGGQPRLILLANPALGVDDDLVLKTMTGGSGAWEQLTGTQTPVAEEDGVVEVVVECDGTAGNLYVDDWSASSA
jgi:hypothetical protein